MEPSGVEGGPGKEPPGGEPRGESAEQPGGEPRGESAEQPGGEPRGESAEQPGGEQPGGEQPGGEQPGGEQPGGEQPGGEQPGGEQPGGEQPGGEQPGGEQPGGEQPGGEQPGGEQPGGEQPGGEQPGGEQRGGGAGPAGGEPGGRGIAELVRPGPAAAAPPREIEELNAGAEEASRLLADMRAEVGRVIVGQDAAVDKLIIALLSQGHVLLEGVPGLAKTLLIRTLAECIDSGFVRLQFTPDLLPADITGTKVYDHGTASFTTVRGPIFSNFVLADEINRAPPKVQSALLEAMQEGQVSIQGETHGLDRPFFVMATQNPIESEGTYRLPEAQVDRFMFKLLMSYPKREEEERIIERFTEGITARASRVVTAAQLLGMQEASRRTHADAEIRKYAASLVDATRRPGAYGLDGEAAGMIEFGASPRASIWLTLGAKSHALMRGRGYVTPQDVREVAADVLRHRVLITYEAEAGGATSDDVIREILDRVRVP